jgi:hypothetical protein
MKILVALFLPLCALVSPVVATPSIQIIHQQHLETTEGRHSFLANKLMPFTTLANHLNQEIQSISTQVQGLSPKEDQSKILSLTVEMTKKMEKLAAIMPILKQTFFIVEDFEQIDSILQQTGSLSTEQQQVVDRVAFLCNSIEEF